MNIVIKNNHLRALRVLAVTIALVLCAAALPGISAAAATLPGPASITMQGTLRDYRKDDSRGYGMVFWPDNAIVRNDFHSQGTLQISDWGDNYAAYTPSGMILPDLVNGRPAINKNAVLYMANDWWYKWNWWGDQMKDDPDIPYSPDIHFTGVGHIGNEEFDLSDPDTTTVYGFLYQTLSNLYVDRPTGFYPDGSGLNKSMPYNLVLHRDNALSAAHGRDVYRFNQKSSNPLSGVMDFFPLDHLYFNTNSDAVWRNGSDISNSHSGTHKYLFNLEAHGQFKYVPGDYAKSLSTSLATSQFFEFIGDDDVFFYIDGRAVVDLGGIHGARGSKIYLDDLHDITGAKMTLDPDDSHDFDMFYMERNPTESNLYIATDIRMTGPTNTIETQHRDIGTGGIVADGKMEEVAQGDDYLAKPVTVADYDYVGYKIVKASAFDGLTLANLTPDAAGASYLFKDVAEDWVIIFLYQKIIPPAPVTVTVQHLDKHTGAVVAPGSTANLTVGDSYLAKPVTVPNYRYVSYKAQKNVIATVNLIIPANTNVSEGTGTTVALTDITEDMTVTFLYEKQITVPQTGDHGVTAPFTAFMISAAGLMIMSVTKKKKRRQKA